MFTKEDLGHYLNFTANALVGHMAGADRLFEMKKDSILRAAQVLLTQVRRKHALAPEIYRGILLKEKGVLHLPPDVRTFLSFSEDKKIASHFADSSLSGFGRELDIVPTPKGPMRMCDFTAEFLGNEGYIITHKPDYAREVLFHWRLFEMLPYKEALGRDRIDEMIVQREVMILPLGRTFPLIPHGEFVKE